MKDRLARKHEEARRQGWKEGFEIGWKKGFEDRLERGSWAGMDGGHGKA